MRSRYHPFHPDRPDFCPIPALAASSTTQRAFSTLRRLFLACLGLDQNPERIQRISLTPLTREIGSDYCIHRNGSKASSSSVLTGSHHPPALWKARNNYYSSSQPLKLYDILEKSAG